MQIEGLLKGEIIDKKGKTKNKPYLTLTVIVWERLINYRITYDTSHLSDPYAHT